MIENIINKILSGRFISTVFVIGTYCYVIGLTCNMVIAGKLSAEVFLALLSGFSGLATMIVKLYFDREDRNQKNGKDETNENKINDISNGIDDPKPSERFATKPPTNS